MIFSRHLRLAGLLCVLGACGGEPRDASSTPRSGNPSNANDTSAAKALVLAFSWDSVLTADSTESADSVSSVYTSLAEAECRLVEQDAETGATTLRCPGAAGYALLLHDFDARMTVDVVAPGGRTHPLRYSGVITSAFSSLGPRAEWRMRGGDPVAIIVRVNAFEDPETPDRSTSYLAVAKITDREVCVTDRIPPTTPQANEAARQAADQSASRPCMRNLAEQR